MAKVGFDTLTSSLTQTVATPEGGTTQATFDRLYNFYAFGGRVGHYLLGKSINVAPEWQSYLDVAAGRYSNLQSYICESVASKPSTYKALPASGCAGAYGGLSSNYVDSLKRPYRLDIDGALKIPYLPLLVGFDANLGQHALSTGHIDPAFSTPDDLRFLFATKFDVATLLTRLGVPAVSK